MTYIYVNTEDGRRKWVTPEMMHDQIEHEHMFSLVMWLHETPQSISERPDDWH